MPHSNGSGVITGIVSEDGSPKVNTLVAVIDRTTNELVKQTFTGSSGEYSINDLNPDVSDYAVFAKDEDGAIRKNALMQDYVQPANGAIGSSYSYNWFPKLRALSPIALFVSVDYSATEGFTALHPSSNGNVNPVLSAGSVALIAQTDLLGAPDLPIASFTGGQVTCFNSLYYDGTYNNTNMAAQRPTFSLLWGIDTSAAQSIKLANSPSTYPIMSARLTAAFAIIVYRHVGTNAGITAISYTIPAGAKRSGNHLIGISFDYQGDITLYFDGVQVATTSAYAASADSYGLTLSPTRNYLMMGGDADMGGNPSSAVPGAATFKAFLGGAFDQFLTADQHLDIYNSFFVASPPIVTGFKREVCSDTPNYYFPLDNVGKDFTLDGFLPTQALVRRRQPYIAYFLSGTPTVAKKTSVMGAVASYFDGNTMYRSERYKAGSNFTPIGFGRYDWGYEAWVNLETTPTVRGMILSHNNHTARIQSFHINSARKVELLISASVVNTITFDQVLDLGVEYYLYVRIKKTTGTAELFINGAFSQSIAISPTVATLAGVNVWNTSGNISIGGWTDYADKVQDGFKGNLFGVAVYHKNLSDARIAAHYAARLVA
jgi:hypothetical protein